MKTKPTALVILLFSISSALADTKDHKLFPVKPLAVTTTDSSTCHMTYSYYDTEKKKEVTYKIQWPCGNGDGYGMNMLRLAALALTTNRQIKITLSSTDKGGITQEGNTVSEMEIF
ncbi:hypothetical protein ACSETT_28395 [Pseudomonas aeruginosa]|uniref:hypothetical protein n=1 Tax=Pseudomonas aeruginosa TaxID=287 RepID=UPI0031DE1C15